MERKPKKKGKSKVLGRNARSSAAGRVAAWVREHANEMAGLLEKLVAIRTENPPGRDYGECAQFLERIVREAGLECERHQSSGAQGGWDGCAGESQERGICLQASHGSGERVLYFHGHYDVVPAQSAEQFKPRRERSFLFGRGACDMKGGLMGMLFAIRALKECAVRLNGRVSLALVCDEETGGRRGSAWLAQRGLLGRGAIGMLTAEPTSGVIWNANRGAITLRIEVLGKAAHVGLQHRGENAFERMHRVAARLLALKAEVEQRKTEYVMNAEADEEADARKTKGSGPRHSILLIGGQSGGGTNFNVVPERCWFTVDRRLNPEEDFELEKNRLTGLLEDCRREGIPLRWEVLQEGRAASCGEEELLARALSKSTKDVTGIAPQFAMCPGLLEIRFYAAAGIPAYAYGPGLLSVAHGPREYVDLRSVADCATIYALTAMEVLAAPKTR
ncbi:MAG TPA: ArgE/DapE family deacylase [Candidatus Acidoferrum sp.]|nr:ArgE/DapE family deacylase [Candidatus Acidoferrum sp.]